MLQAVEAMLEEYRMLPPGSRVLCAVSGGADSVCLLHCLYRLRRKLGIDLAAAHYNHRLRGAESDRDQQFVTEFVAGCCGPDRLCSPVGNRAELPAVSLTVGSGDVAAQAVRTGRGIEETAREMRYDFLRRTAKELGCTHIATAHTADDQAETLVMNLLRGSGLRGLGGIPPVRDQVIRPLLGVTHREIKDYLLLQGLPWVEDSSNADQRYTRNRVRSQILPALREIAPDVSKKLMATTALLREDEACLEDLARRCLEELSVTGNRVSVLAGPIAAQPDPVALRAVRRLLGLARNGDERCAAAHLRGLAALCRSSDPSAHMDLPGGLTARREYDRLVLTPWVNSPPLFCVPLALPGTTWWGNWTIRCTRQTRTGEDLDPLRLWLADRGTYTVRTRETGDLLSPAGRPAKTIKKWCIDEKIPAWCRDLLPVITLDNQAAAVPGLGTDRAFCPERGESAWLVECEWIGLPGEEPGVSEKSNLNHNNFESGKGEPPTW